MRNKFGFQKEWLHFTRTFRFGGILIAIFCLALANPLLFKMLVLAMQAFDVPVNSVPLENSDLTDQMNALNEMTAASTMAMDSASFVFSSAMAELCATAILVIMLVMMSPCGGEQKKRATIIPICSGLDYKDYLIPKFVLYPSVIFASIFTACVITGFLSNAMFTYDKIDAGLIFFASLLCSIYVAFMFVVYMSIGLCTSRPGIITIFIYLGQSLLSIMLISLGLTRYNPFTLRTLVTGEMFSESFSFETEALSIIVAIALSVIIAVLLFFLTLAVLRAKKYDNQQNKPEF